MRGISLLLLLSLPAAAQDFTVASLSRHTLTNDSVITLARAGFDDVFIFERMAHSRTHFDTSVEGMIALKQAGISEDLIAAMADHDSHPNPFPGPPTPAQRAALPASRVVVDKHWWGFHWIRIPN
jgi:hypothetical protein